MKKLLIGLTLLASVSAFSMGYDEASKNTIRLESMYSAAATNNDLQHVVNEANNVWPKVDSIDLRERILGILELANSKLTGIDIAVQEDVEVAFSNLKESYSTAVSLNEFNKVVIDADNIWPRIVFGDELREAILLIRNSANEEARQIAFEKL